MKFTDLLVGAGIDTAKVLMMRHSPREPALRRVLPLLAADRQDLYNGYQRAQGENHERSMLRLAGDGHVASFIADGPRRALFVGLYRISGARPLTFDQFMALPETIELGALGMKTEPWERPTQQLFDLELQDFRADWKGKLVVEWPKPEIIWCRPAKNQDFPIVAIAEESKLSAVVKHWREINLSWAELRVLSPSYRARLAEWRGIYFIFDGEDGKGYVGSAYGAANLLGRWQNYAASGHGGNKLLRARSPEKFQFTILERVSPDLEPDEVIQLEGTWKDRLHTRAPYGLNEN